MSRREISELDDIPKCPLEDVTQSLSFKKYESCPFHKKRHQAITEPQEQIVTTKPSHTYEYDLHENSKFTAQLLKDIGGSDKIRQMTTRFYAHAFEDETLSKFMFDNDGAANHGQRLGDWIIEKMGGEGRPWTESGRYGMRGVSHYKAWVSDKREKKERGKRFKLDDSRIWMRIMFWSAREVGLHEHKIFWKWYVKFIQSYVGIYTRTAPAYAKKDAEWSKRQANIDTYLENGCAMKDLIGMGRH